VHSDGVGAANSVSRACQQTHARGTVSGHAIRQLLARAAAPPPPTCGSATSANAGLMGCVRCPAGLPTARRGLGEVSFFLGGVAKKFAMICPGSSSKSSNIRSTWERLHAHGPARRQAAYPLPAPGPLRPLSGCGEAGARARASLTRWPLTAARLCGMLPPLHAVLRGKTGTESSNSKFSSAAACSSAGAQPVRKICPPGDDAHARLT
jgi:hypothetical protein